MSATDVARSRPAISGVPRKENKAWHSVQSVVRNWRRERHSVVRVARRGRGAPRPHRRQRRQVQEVGWPPNTAGALAYVTIIPAILFLVMEPYNKDRFIRFHSFQCLFFAGSMFALSIVIMILAFVLAFIPVVGWILDLLLWLTFSLRVLAW